MKESHYLNFSGKTYQIDVTEKENRIIMDYLFPMEGGEDSIRVLTDWANSVIDGLPDDKRPIIHVRCTGEELMISRDRDNPFTIVNPSLIFDFDSDPSE